MQLLFLVSTYLIEIILQVHIFNQLNDQLKNHTPWSKSSLISPIIIIHSDSSISLTRVPIWSKLDLENIIAGKKRGKFKLLHNSCTSKSFLYYHYGLINLGSFYIPTWNSRLYAKAYLKRSERHLKAKNFANGKNETAGENCTGNSGAI